MAPTKTPLLDGVMVRERISADGKTIRQKLFVRAPKNPTTSPSPKPTDPPAPAPAPPPPQTPPAAPPAAAPTTTTTTTTAAEPTPTPTPTPLFTPAQDAQLLDLKSKNTSWKQISIMMDGKPQWQLKDRFKELTAKPAADEGAKVEDKEKSEEEEKKKKKEEDEAKKKVAAAEEKKKAGEERKKAWEEKKRKEAEEKEKEKASAGGGGDEPVKVAAAAAAPEVKEERKIVFVDGGRFSIEEIVLVHKLAERYENRKWLEVASKFFDTTGKRVHPDEMRDALSGGAQ